MQSEERKIVKKVLIVDDSKSVRQNVSFSLSRGGFEVIEAEDGQIGLEKLRTVKDIALVVTDVNMPVMDGLAMLEAIKADKELRKVPVILLTTEGEPHMIARGKAAGAKAWLVKPFLPDQLVAAAIKLAA